MRLRGVRPYLKEVKAKDPDCSLNEHALRKLLDEYNVPRVYTGVKMLFDADYFESLFITPVNGLSKIQTSDNMVAINK